MTSQGKMTVPITRHKDGIRLTVRVQPGSSHCGWADSSDGELKLRITARAIEGEANKAVCEFLSKQFGVAKSCITIERGLTGRNKTILVRGNADRLTERAVELGLTAAPGT